MSEGLNRATLLGNLGQDPELKVLPNGNAVLQLRLATSRSWKDDNGARQEKTEWHSIVVWGPRAEPLSRMLAKGERVYVEGEIETRSWEKDGEKRYATQIRASNVVLCGGKRDGGEQHAPQQSRPRNDAPRGGHIGPDAQDPGFDGEIPF